ncbi:MAG: hypothetical protein NTY00_02100 [Deltaproteobacteria bacterium]|nr:hypothetical protein [Deltaproteobacteria bacterium]
MRALTEILGAGRNGARVELKTGHDPKDIFQVVRIMRFDEKKERLRAEGIRKD